VDELDSADQLLYPGVDYNFVQVVFVQNGQELRPHIKLDGTDFEIYGYQKFRRDKNHSFKRLELIPNGGRLVLLVGESFEDTDTVLPSPPYQTGVVNVREFGAVGDGIVDDTAALQGAATASAGKTLRFPNGTYRITGRIVLPSNIRLVADTLVTINQVTPGEIVFYGNTVTNVSIRGFTLTGAGSANRPILADTAGAIYFTGPAGGAGGGGHFVEDCSISGFWNGICAIYQTGFTVRECDVTAWRIYGILASQTNDFHIDHNRVHGNDTPVAAAWDVATNYGLGATVTANALLWTSLHANNLGNAPPAVVGNPQNDPHWYQTATYCVMATGGRPNGNLQSRCSISFNELRDNPAWDGIMTHDCDGLRIAVNDIRNVRMGLDLGANSVNTFVDKIVVVGNYIEGTNTDSWGGAAANNRGISVSGIDANTAARNVTVTGNVVSNFGIFNPGASMQGGIVVVYAIGVSVTGNRVSAIGPNPVNVNLAAGIAVNQIIQNVSITGNDLMTVTGVSAGILALNVTLTQGLTITGNCVNVGGGLPAVLLSTVTGGDCVSITGNTLRDATDTGTAVRVAGCTLSMLNVSGNAASPAAGATVYRATTSVITREYVDWVKQIPLTVVSTANLTNADATITSGFGAPTVDEPRGSLYTDRNGAAATTLYVKTAAGAAGWTAK
jgi:hypothetical protein